MNITSTNNKFTSTIQNDTSNSYDNIIKQLEKQKTQLSDKIQSIKSSKLDAKTKAERIKVVQEQIEQINAQIQQIQMEKLKERAEKTKNANTDSNSTDNQEQQYISSMTDLVSAKNSISQAENVKKTKTELSNQSRIFNTEIELDASTNLGASTGKYKELEDINKRLNPLDISYADKLKKAISRVKNTTKEKVDKIPETDQKENTIANDDFSDIKAKETIDQSAKESSELSENEGQYNKHNSINIMI